MLLILSDEFDKHADIVVEKLLDRKIDFFRLNLNVQALKHTSIYFDGYKWIIQNKFNSISSDNISCVWARRAFVELTLEEQIEQNADFRIWKNEWNKTLLGLYYYINDAKWLNPLRKSYKVENKYLQMDIAKRIGFNVPEVVVSNNKDQLLKFVNKHNDNVVMKLMAQEFYETNEGFKGLYVNKITTSDLHEFGSSDENPIVLQQYIDKSYEVRYTVVGTEHLVCKIDSQKSKIANTDWRRYDISNTPHFSMEPPLDIKTKIINLMKEFDLEFGALDFIVTPDNKWYFLEINCMGQWLWIEHLTGLGISDSIVKWIQRNIRKEV